MPSRRDLFNTIWLTPTLHYYTSPSRKKTLLLKTRLAGYLYYGADKVYPYVRLRNAFDLRREPHNPYDHKAVEL